MQARTLQQILQGVRQTWMNNLSLQHLYGFEDGETFESFYPAPSIAAAISYVFAYCTWVYENIVANAVNDLETMIALQRLFSVPWYAQKAREFQLGDSLVFDEINNTFSYPVIDEEKQIVKFVSIRQIIDSGLTKLRIYVAKQNKQALTANVELPAFIDYFKKIGAAGTHFDFVSQNPNMLNIRLNVWRNPQVLDSNGNRIAGGGKPVHEAIAKYLDTIEYGGRFYRSKLVDAVQAAEGVMDVVLNEVYMDGNPGAAISPSFESESGFFITQVINDIYLV